MPWTRERSWIQRDWGRLRRRPRRRSDKLQMPLLILDDHRLKVVGRQHPRRHLPLNRVIHRILRRHTGEGDDIMRGEDDLIW